MIRFIFFVCSFMIMSSSFVFAGAKTPRSETSALLTEEPGGLEVKIDAFQEGDVIPEKHTCDGRDRSPAIRWMPGPQGTKSYVIAVEDPGTSSGKWTHWILYDLPPTVFYIPEGFPPIYRLANSEKHGRNDFGNFGYGGPCPPKGEEHRYYFKVYALNTMLYFEPGVKAPEFNKAIQGHILAEGHVMGTYRRVDSE